MEVELFLRVGSGFKISVTFQPEDEIDMPEMELHTNRVLEVGKSQTIEEIKDLIFTKTKIPKVWQRCIGHCIHNDSELDDRPTDFKRLVAPQKLFLNRL